MSYLLHILHVVELPEIPAQDLESYEACTCWRQHVCHLQPADSALSLNIKPFFAEPLNVSHPGRVSKHSNFIESMLRLHLAGPEACAQSLDASSCFR